MKLRKILGTVISLSLCIFAAYPAFAAEASAGAPAVFYSDLTSGPNTGGKDNNGVFVTITGKNFGQSQGSGFVTVGNGNAAGYAVWTDNKIVFQPGPQGTSGEIKVTTAGGTSNGLPFVVRPGSIYFVDDTSPGSPGSGTFEDPWRDPSSFIKAAKAGDTCYFREGSYTGNYGASGANIAFPSSMPSGAKDNEIAIAGYPGENALIKGSQNIGFGAPKSFYVIAGFTMYGSNKCMSLEGSELRIVNNKLEGLKSSAYGIIHPMVGSGFKIYGNEIFGATSGNKRDHPIYVGYGSDNVDIGWNHFHDNNVAEGPVISINTDYAITQHYKFENIRIHDNIIDCRKSSGLRGVGIVATDRGSSVYIYNNTFIGNGNSMIYQYSASSYIYNNTFYDGSGSNAIFLNTVLDAGNDYRPETVDIKNNIFYNRSGCSYISIGNESGIGNLTISNNGYYGNGNGPAKDASAVNADPLFKDAANGDFRLQANSPYIDKGCDTCSVAPADRDGVVRPQNGMVDIGAFELSVLNAASGTATGQGGSGITTDTDTAKNEPQPPPVTSTDPGDGQGTADPPPPAADPNIAGGTPVDTGTTGAGGNSSVASPGSIKVVGSTEGRGTVNPDKGDTAKIYFAAVKPGTYELRIFSITGEVLWESAMHNVKEGMFDWNPGLAASGIYIAHIKGPDFSRSGKVAVVR